MLDRLMAHNDRIPLTPSSLTRFHSRAPPSINVRDYLLRIARYTNVEPCCLLMLLPYVDKGEPVATRGSDKGVLAAETFSDSLCTTQHVHNLVADGAPLHYCERVGRLESVERQLLHKQPLRAGRRCQPD